MVQKLPQAIAEPLVQQAIGTLSIDLRHHDWQEGIYRAHATIERLRKSHLEPKAEPPLIVIADILDDCRAVETLDKMGIYLLGHLTDHTRAEIYDGDLIGHGTLNFLHTVLQSHNLDFKPPPSNYPV